jgi:outer membrane protein
VHSLAVALMVAGLGHNGWCIVPAASNDAKKLQKPVPGTQGRTPAASGEHCKPGVVPQKPYGINDAFCFAYAYNPSFLQARVEVGSKAESMNQVRSEWYPTIDATVNQSFRQKNASIDRRAPTALTEGAPESDRNEVVYKSKNLDVKNPDMQLGLRQNVYAGGGTLARGSIARNDYDASVFSGMDKEQQMFYQVAQLYLEAVQRYEIWVLMKRREQIYVDLSNQARLRFDIGDSRKADLAIAQARSLRNAAEVADAYRALEDARSSLMTRIGSYTPYRLDFTDWSSSDLTMSLDEFMQVSLTNNPMMRAAKAALESAKAGIYNARSALKPTVDMSASLGYENIIERERASNRAWSLYNRSRGVDKVIGLSARWVLFSGGNVQSKCRAQELGVCSARLKVEEVRRSIVQQCRVAYLKYRTARKNLATMRAAYDQNLSAVRSSNDEYLAGSTSMMDLLGMESQYTEAAISLIRALAECALTYYECQMLMGHLTAQHMKLNVKNVDWHSYKNKYQGSFFALGNASKKSLFADGRKDDDFNRHDSTKDQSIDLGCELEPSSVMGLKYQGSESK